VYFYREKTAAIADLRGFLEVKNGRVVKPVTEALQGVTEVVTHNIYILTLNILVLLSSLMTIYYFFN
jgi:hypothetical protein